MSIENNTDELLKATINLIMSTSAWKEQEVEDDTVVYQHPVVKNEYVRMDKDTSNKKWKEILLSPATIGVMITSGVEARKVTELVLKNLGAEYKLATEEQIINQIVYLLVVDDDYIKTMRVLKEEVDKDNNAYHEYMLFVISEKLTVAMAMLLAKKEEGNNDICNSTEM